jgi:PAS domain S-box-containing protein
MDEQPRPLEQENQKLQRLQQEESRLWRVALLFVALLAAGMAASSWQILASFPQRLEAIPLGTLTLAMLFVLYAAGKRKEIAGLQGVMRGMREREQAPPSERQLSRLLEALSNSQRNYRDLIDSLDDVILALSPQGMVRTANRALVDLAGKSFPEIAGHNLDELLDEPTRQQAEKELVRFLERRQWGGVVRVRFKNSPRIFFFDCELRAIVADGEVIGIGVRAQNITSSRERETRFTELFETLQEGVYFTSPEGKLLDCNMALVRMLGYSSKEELLGVPATELYVDTAERGRQIRLLQQTMALRSQESRLYHKNGSMVICLDTARAICDGQGNLVRLQGALFDVTERRKVEDRLHQQEEFVRKLVESFPDLILALDGEGRYTFVSPRIREVLGYEPVTLIGRRLVGDAARVTPAEFQQLFQKLISGEEVFGTVEYGAQHRDGSWRTLRANATPLYDQQGRLSGVVASLRDVSTLKQMEQQLIRAERMAAMGQMIDGFAHELNNPLTAILGAVELLQASVHDQSINHKLQLLDKQAKRAAEVVQNLLFFSRPPAPGKAPLKISDMVQRSLQLHEHSLRLNNVAVDFIADTSLPEVVGDSHRLMQVFLNLIINAEQAIREIRPRGTLRIRTGRDGDRVWVNFQDDGPGISPEMLPRIFDPFFTTKRPGRGTGLGLSVAMAILKKYDGMIDVQPAPGGGAVFTVTLPTVQHAAPKQAATAAS